MSQGKTIAVINISGTADGKAVRRVTDEIKKFAPQLSFLGISEDVEKLKISVFAYVTEDAQKLGLRADEWITAAMKSTSGKGGGKSGSAQGSIANDSPKTMDLVVSQSNQYIVGKELK